MKKNEKLSLFLSFICFILFNITLTAQVQDSLYATWKDQSQKDSVRVKAFKDYIWNGYLFSEPDTAYTLAEEMHKYAEKHNYPIAANQALTLQAIVYDMQANYPMAFEYAQKSIEQNKKIDNQWGISEAMIVIGVLYDSQSNYPKALEYYSKALAIDEKIANKEGMAMSLNNMANIYLDQGNDDKALTYYQKALAIDEELGVKQGIAVELSNIGSILNNQGKLDLALEYYERSLEINKEINDKHAIANDNLSLAIFYSKQKKYDKALAYYEKALMIFKEVGNKNKIASSMTSLGFFYMNQNEFEKALKYCEESLAILNDIGSLDKQMKACNCLYTIHKQIGNSNKALGFFEQMIVLKDSIYNEDNTRQLTRIEMQYEFDKKEVAVKAEQEKKDALVLEEIKQQKIVRNSFMGGFVVVLLFAGVFFIQRNRIGKEKEKSENLLLNILPAETAKELKEKGQSDAQFIDQVSVLFTDFKDFTKMSENVTPKALVKDLHECFSKFDKICEKYKVEKIKTIGDAYMAAGGLPTPNKTHAQDIVRAALEMADVIEKGKAKKIAAGLPYFEIRIGIHTGPVVAGIVGVKKFQYDIWGDTVNTASRMESSSEVGKVNISQNTYENLKHHAEFVFQSRGKIKTKGKDEIGMYYVGSAEKHKLFDL